MSQKQIDRFINNKIMTEPKKQTLKQVITFVVITIIISTGIFIWMFSGAEDSPPAVLLMMYTPGVSAIITSLIYRDKIRNFGWRPGKARILLYSYLLPIIVSLVGYGLVWLTGYSDFTTEEVKNYRWAGMLGFDLPAPFIIGLFSKMTLASLMTIIFVFGEEVGWSGFLTPKLRKIFSIPVTSLIVGVFWAVWHFPAIIGGFYGVSTPLWIALPGFTLVLTGASLMRTVLIEKSKNLWVGVLLHTSHNVILMGIFKEMTLDKGNAFYLVSETGVFLGVVYILIAIVFWRMHVRSSNSSTRQDRSL